MFDSTFIRHPKEHSIQNTAERILNCSERLFAEHGIHATSLRHITSEASVNLAAVHYYFGSKQCLVESILTRRLHPLNAQRIESLNTLQTTGTGDIPLHIIVRLFMTPAFHLWKQAPHFIRLVGRIHSEPDEALHTFFLTQFHPVAQRYTEALARALPDLSPCTLSLRIHFMIGAMIHSWTAPRTLQPLIQAENATPDSTSILEHLITFVTAGLKASES